MRTFDGTFSTAQSVSQKIFTHPFPQNGSRILRQDFEINADDYSRTPISRQHPEHPGFYLVDERTNGVNWAGILTFTSEWAEIPESRTEWESYSTRFAGMVADVSTPTSNAVSGSTYGATNDTVTAAGFSGSALDQVAVEWTYAIGAVTYGGTILRSLVSGGSGSATFAKFRFQYWSGGQTLTVNPTYTSITLVGDGGREPFTKVVQSAVQYDYFLPGVSSNITTHEDIPLVHPSIIIDNTGQRTESYSDTTVPSKASYQSLVSAGALVCVEASTARRWKGEIFERATRYVVAE
jgi:hypothetical protein